MHPQTLWATLGGLLQDVGEMACRAGEGTEVGIAGLAMLKEARALPAPVLDCVRWCKAGVPRAAGAGHVARIVCAAKTLTFARHAGSVGRPDATQPLAPVFTHLNGLHAGWYLPAMPQDETLRMPIKGAGRLRAAEYRTLLTPLRARLRNLSPDDAGVDALLAALETFASTVPAAPCRDGDADISLYDSLKTTAALSACLSEYLRQTGQRDDRALWSDARRLRAMPAFLLYSADFSGVQKFIYTIATQNALRTLRSRSFFLDFLMEHYVDELLRACGVSRANLLYCGGGHCYALLPNTDAARDAAQAWNTRMNEWLMRQFGTRLFLAHGFTPCTADELTNTPAADAPYKAMFRRVTSRVAAHKQRRVTADQLRALNRAVPGETGRECAICGRADALHPGRDRCRWCALFEDLSLNVQRQAVIWVSDDRTLFHHFSLPSAEGEAYIALLSCEEARERLARGEAARKVYTKNRRMDELPGAVCLYVGDYAASNSMQELAQSAQGVRRLAVCRMDVDDLGQAFVAGYEQPQDDANMRYRYVSLARTAAFSRQMSIFFKRYINPLLSGAYGGRTALSLSIVYAGGDDVFLVGAWNDVIEGAARIRQALRAYTCGALSISAGIGLFDDHFPIRDAALQTAELEDAAKALPHKDGVALFGEGDAHAYAWADFLQGVRDEKLRALEDFFGDAQNERGNAMLYHLLSLLRQAQDDRLPLARYAYTLARLEPSQRSEQFTAYRRFADRMYAWALNAQDRRQLITAMMMYIYQNRKER